ncbi:restriction endonuclease subunit S [Pseudoflavonifractor sp. An184]|uniref:restriction endonuclease subunit S n=1 Tax=Pseudoflavonifractor sp. An184 TaxID=1965576 RepID=UPI000B3A306A|nr:restriction endonuclease subunit S [Pseudoflavonifractor sp. An184]OUP54815.1 hypothetical protein B5F19_10820 [Pseudoflavonifractor sp. An184]
MVNGWKTKKLGEVAEVCMCKRIFAHQTSKIGNIPFYKIGTFGKEADAYISSQLYEEYKAKYSYPEKGDVLISAAGTLGRTVVFDGRPAYFQDSNIVWLKIDKSQLCNDYLAHYYKVIKWASSEGSTISRLYNGIICDTEILLPPLEEQAAIAEALSDVDSLISSLQKLIEKKKAIKQGTMQELLTGKKRLPEFSGEWNQFRLGEMTEIYSGGTPSTTISEYWGGSIPWMSSGELNNKKIYDVEGRITQKGMQNSSAHLIPKYCVLIGLAGQGKTRGTAAYNYISLCTNQSIAAIYPNDKKFDSRFLYYIIDSMYESLRELSSGDGGRGGLTKGLISNLEIYMPEVPEQQAVAQVLSDMDSEIEQLEKKLAKYQQIKQGMMQELLTGRIRLVDADVKKSPEAHMVREKQHQPTHNQHFDDAVMIAGIVNAFYSEKYPLGRKKVQKLLYLVRRKEQADISAFHKKAAGPYADEIRYKGGEPIAQKNKYIQVKRSEKGSRFEKGVQMQQALTYLQDWGKQGDVDWLVSQFQYTSVNELELLATVDMAICDLRREGKETSVASIKDLIHSNKEWRDKLKKAYFKDADIQRAIKHCQELFPDKEG